MITRSKCDRIAVENRGDLMERDEIVKVFRHIPTLETERLILRKMARWDAADMYEYASNPAVTRFLTWDVHPNVRFSANYLSYLQSKYRSGEFRDWAVTLRSTGKMIGTCGFSHFNFPAYAAEIGYVLNPAYWGNGVAVEAAACVIRFGFEYLELNRIEARCMTGNTQSRRVMEKLGMTYEGTIREGMFVKNRFISVEVCSILKKEFYDKTSTNHSAIPFNHISPDASQKNRF